jgi:hypothetical protein
VGRLKALANLPTLNTMAGVLDYPIVLFQSPMFETRQLKTTIEILSSREKQLHESTVG